MARWAMMLLGAFLVIFLLVTGYRLMKTVEGSNKSKPDAGKDNSEHI